MVDRLAEDLLARGIVAELRRSVVSFDCTTFGQAYSRIASPAPLRLASRISEYLRDRSTPGAPARNAARTASFTLCGVDLLLLGSVGISISMPGRSGVRAGDSLQCAFRLAIDVVGRKPSVGNLIVAALLESHQRIVHIEQGLF